MGLAGPGMWRVSPSRQGWSLFNGPLISWWLGWWILQDWLCREFILVDKDDYWSRYSLNNRSVDDFVDPSGPVMWRVSRTMWRAWSEPWTFRTSLRMDPVSVVIYVHAKFFVLLPFFSAFWRYRAPALRCFRTLFLMQIQKRLISYTRTSEIESLI